MKNEDAKNLVRDLDDAELIDLGASSELTEGGTLQPAEGTNSSDPSSGF